MKHYSELGITREEYNALLWVKHQLQLGEINGGPNQFDMSDTGSSRHGCGSSACIGGWVHTYMVGANKAPDGHYYIDAHQSGDYVRSKHGEKHPLYRLYFPDIVQRKYEDITAEEGIEAIDNFLTTGDPDWKKVLGEEGEG